MRNFEEFSRRRDRGTTLRLSLLLSLFSRFLVPSRSPGTPPPPPFALCSPSESPFEEVGHANVGGRVSGRPRASATTTSPRYQGQNTGRRMSLLLSANEEVASHSANIMKALLLRCASRKRSFLSAFGFFLSVPLSILSDACSTNARNIKKNWRR